MTVLFIILKLDGKPLNAGKAGCNLYQSVLQVDKETILLNWIAQRCFWMLYTFHVHYDKLMRLHESAELVNIELSIGAQIFRGTPMPSSHWR